MKKRHFVLGLAAVLTLSVVIPAFGGPLGLRASSGTRTLARLRTIAKKAQSTAAAATQLAETAQSAANAGQSSAERANGEAGNAQAAAERAQSAAQAAQTAASDVQPSVDAATAAANSAQSAAAQAGSRVDSFKLMADGTLKAANDAVADAAQKFGKVEEVVEPASQCSTATHECEGVAHCPAGTRVVSGGFLISAEPAEPHISKPLPSENGWYVDAQSGGNQFRLEVVALCLSTKAAME